MIVSESTWDGLKDYRDYLEHYGRKGMKWYQHLFGDYQSGAKYAKQGTEKRKKRTFSEGVKAKRAARARKKIARAKARAEKKAANEAKKIEKKEIAAAKKAEKKAAQEKERKDKILSNPKTLYKHRKEFTYEEINAAIRTFDWERKLKSYSDQDLKNGAEYIGTLYKGADNAVKLYNVAARVVNSLSEFNGQGAPLPFIKEQKEKKDEKKKNKKDDD